MRNIPSSIRSVFPLLPRLVSPGSTVFACLALRVRLRPICAFTFPLQTRRAGRIAIASTGYGLDVLTHSNLSFRGATYLIFLDLQMSHYPKPASAFGRSVEKQSG
jgi:hypothetical protein